MERELMLSGIGGQGIQLGASILARAATLEGRNAMLFGIYGGAMRGGSTESTVVVSDGEISAPPIVSQTWSAIVMHHAYWQPLRAKLRADAVVLLNTTIFEGALEGGTQRVFEVPATAIAQKLGSPLAATMVMAGAYIGLTGLVGLETAIQAMAQALPSYRRQHAALNERALRAGAETVPAGAASAWPEPGATP